MAVGGDILEVTVNHPTLGTKTFSPKAGEDSTFDLGGFRTNDDANGITAKGDLISQLSRVRGSFECVVTNDMNSGLELEFITSLTGDPTDADWTISHINGSVYKGKGRPVGDIQAAGMATTFTLKVACSALKKIA